MAAGKRLLHEFCAERLKIFATSRNDPTKNAISGLSPWLHYGMYAIRPMRCIAKRPRASMAIIIIASVRETQR